MAKLSRYRRANEYSEVVPSGVIPARGSVGARLDTNTNPAGDSLSPRRRSGERVRERGFQESATIRWNEPLSPLVPRREREQETSAMVGVSRCARFVVRFRPAASTSVRLTGASPG